MNHLMAKIRLRGNAPKYRMVLSDVTLYSLPEDIETFVAYSPDHNLDVDSWFGIPEFASTDYCLDIVQAEYDTPDYEQLALNETDKVDFLFSCQSEGNEYYFQRVTKAQYIKGKGFLRMGDNHTYEQNTKTVVINKLPDAIYIKDRDILFFKNLFAASGIFRGLDALYREATAEETRAFLEGDYVQPAEGYSVAKVGKMNRRRIAKAMDTLESYSNEEKTNIFAYVRDYCPDLPYDGEKFSVSSEDEMKQLIYGIEQRYFTTLVGGERRVANSIVTIAAQQNGDEQND